MSCEGLPRAFPGGRLRRLHPCDLDAFQAYRAIPEVALYQGWSVMTQAQARDFLQEMHGVRLFRPGTWTQLGIATAEDVLVGDVGVHLSDDALTAEIGFTLQPKAQGRGIATGAVKEALELLFALTPARRAYGITDTRNIASIRLLERVGFRFEEERDVVFRGEPCREKIYRLDRIVPS
jgi:RimJ/RimL family protein N-acetyltransferase